MAHRKIQIQDPVNYPARCINCGAVQSSGRWFVDLGFDIDHIFDALPEGTVYLCSECTRTFIRELMTVVEQKEMGLDYVRFRGNRTDPVFDEHRETIDAIECAIEQNSANSEPEDHPVLTATFGGG